MTAGTRGSADRQDTCEPHYVRLLNKGTIIISRSACGDKATGFLQQYNEMSNAGHDLIYTVTPAHFPEDIEC